MAFPLIGAGLKALETVAPKLLPAVETAAGATSRFAGNPAIQSSALPKSNNVAGRVMGDLKSMMNPVGLAEQAIGGLLGQSTSPQAQAAPGQGGEKHHSLLGELAKGAFHAAEDVASVAVPEFGIAKTVFDVAKGAFGKSASSEGL